MGSEHSREAAAEASTEATENNPASGSRHSEELSSADALGRDSPRPSICSEGDLPYISYTVNRPIGDSPKHLSKGVRALRATASANAARKPKRRLLRPQEVVVVKEGNTNKGTIDPDLEKLQRIPTFLPIMRGALTAPSARDPEVLERLNSSAFIGLCRRYQVHLHANASYISEHQDEMTKKIKDVDANVNRIIHVVTDRQRAYARYAERLSQVTEVSHSLSRCHTSLNLILESLETLNDFLPVEDRLEPFIWTTG